MVIVAFCSLRNHYVSSSSERIKPPIVFLRLFSLNDFVPERGVELLEARYVVAEDDLNAAGSGLYPKQGRGFSLDEGMLFPFDIEKAGVESFGAVCSFFFGGVLIYLMLLFYEVYMLPGPGR